MKKFIKEFPLVKWLRWVMLSIKLKKLYPTLFLGGYSEIVNCKFGHQNIIHAHCKLIDTVMGDYSYVGGEVHIQYCTIGKLCSIAEGVKIGLGIHPLNLESTHPAFYKSPSQWDIIPDEHPDVIEYKHIFIGDDVWIGTNALVLDGVSIGNHAVVAAGAVVTKDVPEYAIVGGVPAKIIKYRQRINKVKS